MSVTPVTTPRPTRSAHFSTFPINAAKMTSASCRIARSISAGSSATDFGGALKLTDGIDSDIDWNWKLPCRERLNIDAFRLTPSAALTEMFGSEIEPTLIPATWIGPMLPLTCRTSEALALNDSALPSRMHDSANLATDPAWKLITNEKPVVVTVTSTDCRTASNRLTFQFACRKLGPAALTSNTAPPGGTIQPGSPADAPDGRICRFGEPWDGPLPGGALRLMPAPSPSIRSTPRRSI